MGWRASISISSGDLLNHLIARVDGDSAADAKIGTQLIFDAFAKGRETYIRAVPDVVSERDFDTKVLRHRGFVRFSFADHEGPHHMPNPSAVGMASLGLIQEAAAEIRRMTGA